MSKCGRCYEYDYIIVGAGGSGAVLAYYLSKKYRVLLMEAGTNELNNPVFNQPDLLNLFINSTNNKIAYQLPTLFDLAVGKQFILQWGRTWGGGTFHNYKLHYRSSQAFWNYLASLLGDDIWNYASVLPSFKDIETYTGESQSPEQRGNMGAISVRQSVYPRTGTISNVLTLGINAVTQAPIVEDYNVIVDEGISILAQLDQTEDFINQSSASGFLNSNVVNERGQGVNGHKLRVLSKCTANKVIIEKECGEVYARGVKYIQNGYCNKAYASKGVIIAAGWDSSGILERSGYGNRDVLLSAGVKPKIINNNVGENLQAHFFVPFLVETNNALLNPTYTDPLITFGGGLFNVPGEVDTPYARVQLINIPGVLGVPPNEVFSNQWFNNPASELGFFSTLIINNIPKSKGFIHISHSDPTSEPVSSLNALSDADDVDFFVRALQMMYQIIVRMRIDNPQYVFNIKYPDEAIFLLPADVQYQTLSGFVRGNIQSQAHFAGFNRMGESIDNSVVSSRFKVHGVNNWFVTDLSTLPIIPPGNTGTPAMMMGRHAYKILTNQI